MVGPHTRTMNVRSSPTVAGSVEMRCSSSTEKVNRHGLVSRVRYLTEHSSVLVDLIVPVARRCSIEGLERRVLHDLCQSRSVIEMLLLRLY